jgi:CHAT domain-containing protein
MAAKDLVTLRLSGVRRPAAALLWRIESAGRYMINKTVSLSSSESKQYVLSVRSHEGSPQRQLKLLMLPVTVRSKLHGLCSIVLVGLCLTVLLVLSPVHQLTSVVSDEPAQVTPGSAVRGEITAGAKRVFAVSANEGTLLRFSIDKGDLALATIVYGPSGAQLAEHVSEDFEIVDLSVPVDVSGSYRIEIQSREKVDTRPYELKVETLRPITPALRKDTEARQAMNNAGVKRAKWKEASLTETLDDYEKAAASWTSLGNLSSASQAILKSGDVYFLLSKYEQALKQYQSAATLAAKAHDPLAEAKARSHLGRLHSYFGKNELAQDELTKAKDLLGPIDADTNSIIKNTYGEALCNIGEVIYSKGNMLKAREQFDQALAFLKGDRKGEARVHLFAAYIDGSLGLLDKAIGEISKALELYKVTNDRRGEGLATTVLGLDHTIKGQQDPAIKLHKQASAIFQEIGDRNSAAVALNATGQVYEGLKDFSAALSNYQNAAQIFHESGALEYEAGTIFKVAQMQRLLKNFEQALSSLQLCLKLSRSAGKQRTEANALSDIALVYAAQGRNREALQESNKALKFYERIHDLRGQVNALNDLGTIFLQNGKKLEAAEAFRRALPLSEQVADTGTIITTFCNLARAERALGHLDEALSVINRSLKQIEELRTDVGSFDLRASYFSGVRENYELGIDILAELERARPGNGSAAEALLLSEKSRARALLDLIRESGADLRHDAPKELIDREAELGGLLRVQSQYQMRLKPGDKDSSEVEKQISELKSQYQDIQARIREQDPRALSLSRFEPLSLQDIQKELSQEDVLIEIALGDERSHLWMVTPGSFQYFQLPDRKTIEDLSVDVYNAATTRQKLDGQADTAAIQAQIDESDKLLRQKAPELSQMLFGQIATELGSKRLLLVTEGKLQFVPFDALPAPGGPVDANKWLILDHEIVQLPSIATLRAIRAAKKKNRDAADKIAAVLADPVFARSDTRVQNSSSLAPAVASAANDVNRSESTQRALESLRNGGSARLIHSSEEANAIAKAAPRGTTMIATGFDATRETAMNARLGEYQIVHFATHGFLDSEHPELSGIVLTMVDKNGVEKNGMMPLHDIYNMDLSAELTVLSACETALGKDIKGEGFIGLTHSFISAGSKSVVASLWKVDDRATAALMDEMYQSMLQKGMSPAAALRAAKLKVMQDKRWSNPYYWAGFVVQGEYTNHITIDSNSRRNLGVIVLLSLLLTSCGLIVFRVLAAKRRKQN